MFGKINANVSYGVNALRVYILQRFPANKVPLFAVVLNSIVCAGLANNIYWRRKISRLNSA